MSMQENIELAPLTTIKLGGSASRFVAVASVLELKEALEMADKEKLPVHILGGGSNTVFSDDGFAGLVIKIDLKGIEFGDDGLVTVAAGEPWDDLVQESIKRGLAGFETLSGIPGLVGATPMQNVGAYGQEVSQTITQVKVLNRKTLKEEMFSNQECNFSYRGSRFKHEDKNKYVITEVTYKLDPNGQPDPTYPQLVEAISSEASLEEVREAVLKLRKSKSMIIDSADPNSRSCGSFFVNPILNADEIKKLKEKINSSEKIPTFVDDDSGKQRVPAAWLIEQAGFTKGEKRNGVGISANHPLALININGTTRELLNLAEEIKTVVKNKTGLALVQEPVVVNS